MVGMLGSRGADNTLSGLVNIVSDPKKFQKAMADLKDATAKHRAEREAAAKQKVEADKAIGDANARLAELAEVEAKVATTQKQISAAKSTVATARAAHDQRVSSFDGEMKAAQAALAAKVATEEKLLAAKKAEFEQEIRNRNEAVTKASASVKTRQAGLDALAAKLEQRGVALNARETDVATLELDVRTRIKKINELFPIS